MHRFQTLYVPLAAAVLAMSTAAQEVGSHYTFNGLQAALGNSVSGVDFITSHTEVGGHFQTSVASIGASEFPTEGESYLIISSGDSRLNPGENTDGNYGECGADPLYDFMCDVGGVSVEVALPAQATSLWLDYKYWTWEGFPFLDPYRIFLETASGTSLVAQGDLFSEVGAKPAPGDLAYGALHSLMLDVTAYAGETVTLRFEAADQWDSVYDSGLLIDNLQVAVPANQPPVANAGLDKTVNNTSPAGAVVGLNGQLSSDPDGDTLTYHWSAPAGITFNDPTSPVPTAAFPIGMTVVTLTVSDGAETATDTVQVTVVDTVPPKVTIKASLDNLWPPNQRIEHVTFTITATDLGTSAGNLVLQSVTARSDEPDKENCWGGYKFGGDVAGADGYTAPVNVTSAFTWKASSCSFVGKIDLRAERDGDGDGRTYTVTATVKDASGNLTTVTTTVVVPHSQGKSKKKC